MTEQTRGPIPAQGAYFDRVDEMGVKHERFFYQNGELVISAHAAIDPDRPAKWRLMVRWHRIGKWHTKGWGPLDEPDVHQCMDLLGIGAEGMSGGSLFLPYAIEAEAAKDVPMVQAAAMAKANGWVVGTKVRKAGQWGDKDMQITAIDPENGVELTGNGQRFWTKTLATDATAVPIEGVE